MYYVYMLWCRDDTLYTGTASDLLPGVAAEPVPGVTLAMCLEGEFHE